MTGNLKTVCLVVIATALLTGLNQTVFAGLLPGQHAITAGRDLLLEGENIHVVGDVHANGRVTLRGSIVIEGTVEAGKEIVIEGRVSTGQLRQRAQRTTLPIVDFVTLKRQAARILSGDTQLPSLQFIFGTTYIAGSIIMNHPSGSGALVADGDITVRAGLGRPSSMPVDLISHRRLSLSAGSVSGLGLIGLQGVDVQGSDLSLRGPIIGGDVHIRGTNIKVQDGPAAFPRPFPSAFPAPRIHEPMAGTAVNGAPFQVIGSSVPNARIRISVGYLGTSGQGYASTAEIPTDPNGRFSHSLMIIVRRPPGSYFVIAEVTGPEGRLSPVTAVPIRVSPTP